MGGCMLNESRVVFSCLVWVTRWTALAQYCPGITIGLSASHQRKSAASCKQSNIEWLKMGGVCSIPCEYDAVYTEKSVCSHNSKVKNHQQHILVQLEHSCGRVHSTNLIYWIHLQAMSIIMNKSRYTDYHKEGNWVWTVFQHELGRQHLFENIMWTSLILSERT
jgi:hypothetical protein